MNINNEPQQLGSNTVQLALQKKKLAQYQAALKNNAKNSHDFIQATKPIKMNRKHSGKSDSSGGISKNKGSSSHSSEREATTLCPDQNTKFGDKIG